MLRVFAEAEYVQRVDDAGNVAQDGQEDVYQEIGAATALKEDTDRWDEDGEDDFDDVAVECVSMSSA